MIAARYPAAAETPGTHPLKPLKNVPFAGSVPVQVKRNASRFPSEYCFRLTDVEMDELVTNCDRFATSKHFTKTLCGICHDRFIVVDQKEIFWTGASLKDAGRLTFAAAKMGAEMIPGLLASVRNAASERKEYGKAAS